MLYLFSSVRGCDRVHTEIRGKNYSNSYSLFSTQWLEYYHHVGLVAFFIFAITF